MVFKIGFHYPIVYVTRYKAEFFYVIIFKNDDIMTAWKKILVS